MNRNLDFKNKNDENGTCSNCSSTGTFRRWGLIQGS
jgi:hypothetical protein